MDDLRRRLEQLAQRGEPRGAEEVLAEARQAAAGGGAGARIAGWPARTVIAVAIAASVLLIAGIAGAVWLPDDERPAEQVAGPTTTAPAPTTPETTSVTEPPPTAPPVTVPARVVAASRLQGFESWNAFLRYVKPKGAETVGPWGLPALSMGGVVFNTAGGRVAATGGSAAAEAGGDGQAAAAAPPLAATDAYSRTNVQEEGIDEPDVAKTDGRTIFTLVSGSASPEPQSPQLRAIDGRGPARLLGSLSIPGVQQLFLTGDRVVAMGTDWRPGTPERRTTARTVVAVVDVSRPDAMRLLSRMEVEGSFLSARLVAGVPRIVIRSSPDDLPMAYPQQGTPEEMERVKSHNQQVVRDSGIDDWVPAWTMAEGPRKGRSGRLTTYDQIYRPPVFSGFGMLSVLTLDMADPSQSEAASVMADGDIVYGSATRIYVASNGWGPFSPEQGVQPVSETLVHMFDISSPERATYRVSGKVRGVALNQFSMSEHDGYLRIATTAGFDSTESFVSVLADRGQAMVEVGQVGGLGRGERIQAVRFIGTTGYVVTFRQVDPLYVVDLSDPTRPRVRGELKILGYSAYLHPVGEGRLLGVGVAATEEGRRQGIQASLFDVSDPAAPKVLSQHTVDNAYSEAEFDHHAFLWWPATRLAMFPVNHFADSPENSFVGAIGLRVDPGAIAEVGRVRHPSQSPEQWYVSGIQRALVIGDRLYTVSAAGVRQSDLATLAEEAWVAFT